MGKQIVMAELEAAINRYRAVQPARGGILSAQVSALAIVYGWMIWHRLREVNTDTLPDSVRVAYECFYGSST